MRLLHCFQILYNYKGPLFVGLFFMVFSSGLRGSDFYYEFMGARWEGSHEKINMVQFLREGHASLGGTIGYGTAYQSNHTDAELFFLRNYPVAVDHVWLSDLSCCNLVSTLGRLSRNTLLSIKSSMEELLHKFKTDKFFRQRASAVSKIGNFETKKVGKKRFWRHRKKNFAIERFARHTLSGVIKSLGEVEVKENRLKRWFVREVQNDAQEVRAQFCEADELEIQNFKEIFLAHRYHERAAANPDSEKIIVLGEEMLERYSDEPALIRKRLLAFVEALRQGVESDAIVCNVQEEVVSIEGEGKTLKDAFNDMPEMTDLVEVVTSSGGVARSCANAREYEEGYSLLDFAWMVLGVGKQFGKVCAWSVIGGAVGVGASLGATLELAGNMVRAPIDTATNLALGACELVGAVGRAAWLCATQPEEFKQEIKKKIEALEAMLAGMPPEKRAYEASKVTTMLLFPLASAKLGFAKQFGKLVKAVGKAAQHKVMAYPFAAAVHQGYETAKVATKFWTYSYGKNISDFLKKKGAVLRGFEIVDGAVAEVGKTLSLKEKLLWFNKCTAAILKNNAAVAEGKWSWHALRHVVSGEFQGGKLKSGLHNLKCFEKFRRRLGLGIDKFRIEKFDNGITKIRFPIDVIAKGKKKRLDNVRKIRKVKKVVKTFWPEDFTPLDVIECTKELLESSTKAIVNKKPNGFAYEGMISKGFKVRTVLSYDGNIITTYPLVR